MLETRVIRGSKKVEGMREKNAGKTIVQRLSTTGSWNDTLKGLYSFLSSFFKFQSFDVQVVIPVFFFFFRFVNCSPFSFFSFTFFQRFVLIRAPTVDGIEFNLVKYKSK